MTKIILLLILPFILLSCRFDDIDHGQFFRSPQPNQVDLEKYINENGIKTVINLRGEHKGESWYDTEAAVLKKYNVELIDIGMSASRLPHREDLIKLLDAFKNAQKPILIHCKAGVDRTGEAAAIYQMIYMNKSKADAMEMLSSKYGHFEAIMPAKDYFIRDVWVDENWARTVYDPCKQDYKFYDKNNSVCQPATTPTPNAQVIEGDT